MNEERTMQDELEAVIKKMARNAQECTTAQYTLAMQCTQASLNAAHALAVITEMQYPHNHK